MSFLPIADFNDVYLRKSVDEKPKKRYGAEVLHFQVKERRNRSFTRNRPLMNVLLLFAKRNLFLLGVVLHYHIAFFYQGEV